MFIIAPPPVTDIANNGKGGKGKVKNTRVHSFGRLLSKLLGRFSTDGTLSCRLMNRHQGKRNDKKQYKHTLFHSIA